MQNSSSKPRDKSKNQQQKGPKPVASNQLSCTPAMTIIQFNDIKNSKNLFSKIKQFN